MNPVVQLDSLSKTFIDGEQRHPVLVDLTLTIEQGDTVALTGASGSGKSTLLNLVAGFEHPTSGQLSLLGDNVTHWSDSQWSQFRHRHLGVVFQQFNLLTPLNVYDNIDFPLQLNRGKWSDWGDHLVAHLGLQPLLKREVSSLSGGQQQRVAIARALIHKPKLLLADEPTGNLDQAASLEVMALLSELASQCHTSILLVTHSQQCAEFMKRHWVLNQGRIYE